jgi:hypothetical protein
VACKTGVHVGLNSNSANLGHEDGRAPRQARRPCARRYAAGAGRCRAARTDGGESSENLVSLKPT